MLLVQKNGFLMSLNWRVIRSQSIVGMYMYSRHLFCTVAHQTSFAASEELNTNNSCNSTDIRYLHFKHSMRSETIYNNQISLHWTLEFLRVWRSWFLAFVNLPRASNIINSIFPDKAKGTCWTSQVCEFPKHFNSTTLRQKRFPNHHKLHELRPVRWSVTRAASFA